MKKICIKKNYLYLFLIILVLTCLVYSVKLLTQNNLSYKTKAETVKLPVSNSGNYIIGCKDEKISNWPFVVSIYYKKELISLKPENYFIYNNHICGGTLIADNWILTAAHCFYDDKNVLNKDNIKIAIGYTDLLNDKKNTTTRIINKNNIFIHESYLEVEDLNWNDIALVKISPKVKDYSSALLPTGNNYVKSNGYILGWGFKTKDPSSPDYKISANLCGADVIFSNLNDVTSRLTSNSINSAFYGDSGGPLITNNQYLSGIISTGFEGSDSTMFYVDVYKYLNWITSKMEFYR